MANPVGIVLAGGASRRMGADKATVRLRGKPMIEWVIDAVSPHVSDLLLVGRESGLAGIDAVPDAWRGRRGPLAGLATGLRLIGAPVLLVAVDQPLLRTETVKRLLQSAGSDVAVVPDDGVLQVTCARYPAGWADEAARVLEAEGSLTDLVRSQPHVRVERSEWSAWGEDGRSWFSFDTTEATLEAERRFRIDLRSR